MIQLLWKNSSAAPQKAKHKELLYDPAIPLQESTENAGLRKNLYTEDHGGTVRNSPWTEATKMSINGRMAT